MAIIKAIVSDVIKAVTIKSGPRGPVGSVTEPLEQIIFDPTAPTPPYAEGALFYDDPSKTLVFFNENDQVTVNLDGGLIRVYNSSTTETLIDGRAVYITDVIYDGSEPVPTVAYADATEAATSTATIGQLTSTIAPESFGYVAFQAWVHGIDTDYLTAGLRNYLGTAGDGKLQHTPPASPAYIVDMGGTLVSDAVDGVTFSNPMIRGNTQSVIKIFNGAILEDHQVDVTSDGADITLILDDGADFLSLFFNGTFSKLDVPASIILTEGTDSLPVLNYVYVLASAPTVLSKSIVGWPATQHVPVARVFCPTAALVQLEGAYSVHAWTDHLAGGNNQGHLSHLNRWIRANHAIWLSGAQIAVDATDPTDVSVRTLDVGNILQLHEHNFPIFTDPADVFVINDSVTPYNQIANLVDLGLDAVGGSLSNRSFAFVLWGVVSEDESDCKLMLNLPSGSYAASKPEEADADISKFTNYSIPEAYRGTGFLIRRIVAKYNVTGTQMTIFDYDGDDLRGSFPNTIAGTGISIPDTISNAKFQGSTETISPEVVTGAATAYAFILDMDYNRHALDVSALGAGDVLTITLANLKAGRGVQSVVLTFETGADVTFTIVPPSGMAFTALNASVRTKVVQETEDDGVVWDESVVGEF